MRHFIIGKCAGGDAPTLQVIFPHLVSQTKLLHAERDCRTSRLEGEQLCHAVAGLVGCRSRC